MSLVDKNRRLRLLYARVPAIACRGLCHEACGPVALSMGPHEHSRMTRALGKELDHDPVTLSCSALGADNRCQAYDTRPMICRVYGVADGLPCPHGCEPERMLTDAEAHELLIQSRKI